MFMVAYVNGGFGISDGSWTQRSSNLLRNRRSASSSTASVRPSDLFHWNWGPTSVTARNSPTQKHGCEPCHRVRRKRCPGLQVCAAFQVERMGERQPTCTLTRCSAESWSLTCLCLRGINSGLLTLTWLQTTRPMKTWLWRWASHSPNRRRRWADSGLLLDYIQKQKRLKDTSTISKDSCKLFLFDLLFIHIHFE